MNSNGRLDVLIVAVNYAPELGGTAPYTADAAEHLAARGHNVEVVTGMPHYPRWEVSPEYAGMFRIREMRNGVKIRRLRHYVPSSQSAAKRTVYETSFALHAMTSSRMKDPDVVLAVIPGLLGAVVAQAIAHRSRARLVLWVQDSVSRGATQTGIPGGRAAARMIAGIERRLMRSADDIVVISGAFREQMEALDIPTERIHLVRNWSHLAPPRIPRATMRRQLGWGDDEVIALHAGNMGMKQGLENVVDAGRLAHSRGSNVRFVLMGDGNQRRALQARAEGIPNVTFIPPASDDDYTSVLSAANILVVNERHGVYDMSLPSKLTSYALAGQPVVAAVALDGETAREIRRTGNGTVIDNDSPTTLLAAVPLLARDEFVRHRAAVHARHLSTSRTSIHSRDQLIAIIENGHGSRA